MVLIKRTCFYSRFTISEIQGDKAMAEGQRECLVQGGGGTEEVGNMRYCGGTVWYIAWGCGVYSLGALRHHEQELTNNTTGNDVITSVDDVV